MGKGDPHHASLVPHLLKVEIHQLQGLAALELHVEDF